MRKLIRVSAAIATSALAFTLTACGSDDPLANNVVPEAPAVVDNADTAGSNDYANLALSGQFVGAGASTQQSAMEAWIANFQNDHPGVSVVYDPNGSGAGRTQFLDGGALWAGSDVVLSDAEIETSLLRCGPEGAIDLPVYISPIAIAFNLPGIDSLNLNPEVLAGIFTGSITTWNDPAIAADNPGVDLPSTAITPVHRTDNSGTTQNFADYLAATAPSIWTWEPAGTWPMTGGESAQGTSGVVNVVNSTVGAITYADYSQVGTLGTAAVLVGSEWVPISAAAAAAAVDASPQLPGRHEHDMAIALDRNTSATGAYPLVLISYTVVCLNYENEMDANFVQSFMTWITSAQGQDLAAQVAGSSPISEDLRSQIAQSLAAITHG